jgi:tRNA pseudouridine synthase 10
LILEEALGLIEETSLCDHCLGRQFAMLGYGLSNRERGYAIKALLVFAAHRLMKEGKNEESHTLEILASNGLSQMAQDILAATGVQLKKETHECYLCGGAFNRLDELAKQSVEKLSEYDYASFLVGIKAPPEIENKEDELRARHHLSWGESIRNEFSREIGKRIQEATRKDVNLKRPDILITIDPFSEGISLIVNAAYVSGRYRKLVRGIPQSRWFCSSCQGRGCEICGGTGKLYQESVEELVGNTLMEAYGGTNFVLHAAGREDIDVRTFGDGRPFVMEIEHPKRRHLDLEELTTAINGAASGKVEVLNLRESSREEIRRLKASSQSSKTYQAIVEFSEEVNDDQLERLEVELGGREIEQLTPTRVSHRRANLIRKKHIYELKSRRVQTNRAELVLRCQGGLYIKELISGDGGRTRPSVSDVLGVPAKCVQLDVMNVAMGDTSEVERIQKKE